MKRWRLTSRPLTLCLFVLATALSVSSFAQGPAPMSKQLRIGIIGSGDNNIDTHSSGYTTGAWQWVANHYGYYAGGIGIREMADSIKHWNPNFKITKYDLHARHGIAVANVPSDSMNVIRYAQSLGFPLESLLVIAKGTVIINNQGCPTTDGYCGNITTNAGGIVKFANFNTNQQRMMFDPRSKWYGYYLAHTFDSICTTLNIDGIFGDEYGNVGYSGVSNNYQTAMSLIWPLKEANYWVQGWNNFKRPFNFADSTQIYAARDTLRGWDSTRWFKFMCDSLVDAKHRIYFMNTDGCGGSIPGNWSQWALDISPMARRAHASAQGEYSYFYPTDGNYYENCRQAIRLVNDAKNWAREFGIFWIRTGQYDEQTQGVSLDRSQMTALGLMLDITAINKSTTNPYGTTDLYFLPCLKNGQTDFYWNYARAIGTVTHQDTLALWNYAWGKYFGAPTGTLDTSQTGTDGSSQTYRIDKAVFLKPSSTDTLTLAIGRIARGTTSYDSATTGVSVTLPGSAAARWYPLRSRSHVVSWDAPLTGGSVIKIANGHFQIFSRDTVLSNTASTSSPTDSIPPAKVNDLGCLPGSSAAQLILTWTAPGNDGNTGTAAGYDVGYSTDSVTATNWSTASVTHVLNPVTPIVAGGSQILTLTSTNGLLGGTKYYVGLKAYDGSSNYGVLSNIPSATTKTLVDTIPPNKVTNLALVAGAAPAQLVLTWTAPGNNGSTGKAKGYQIGYSTDSITAATWSTSSVIQVGNLVTPAASGASQSLSLSSTNGLLAGTKYWVALKAFDSANNYSALSNIPSATTKSAPVATDSIPPARVTNLACAATAVPAQLQISWTAPGNDGTTGLVAGYEIGYSTDSITDATWPTSKVVQVGHLVTPVSAGATQSLLLGSANGLVEGTKYWVGLKAYDGTGNYAPLSNVPSAITKINIETGGDVCVATNSAPASGALVNTAVPTLTVQNTNCNVTGAHTYLFQIAHDTLFNDLVAESPRVSEGLQLTSWAVPVRLATGRFFWHVAVDTFSFNDYYYFDLKPQTIAYPNPVSLSKAGQVTFTDLPHGANLLITAINGEVIKRWTAISASEIKWDGANESGNVVSPGTYLWYLENSGAKGKIVILP